MRVYKISSIVFIFLLVSGCSTVPSMSSSKRKQLVQYYQSGQYGHEIASVVKKAISQLKNELRKKHRRKMAIVLDIDETALDNIDTFAQTKAVDLNTVFEQKVRSGTYHAVAPTYALYKIARKNGVAIFFVTGRFESMRAHTIKNLQQGGYRHWDGLYLKPKNYKRPTVVDYKSAARASITQQGYEIVLNIGDQQSDLTGGYAKYRYKLPNPFYTIP